jgi:diaminohydroxyphosphoribosylaminopyrimidine deaminase/5-amino-6-(5-phosphoribosylamino)uracil reductase
MTPDETRHRFMAMALSLGERGLGRTWPNPSVGCVVVKNGRVVGRGWTHPGGRPHAEAMALEQAGEHARGADVYVSLEPCAHVGQTPPCAKALVNAGVARVFCALGDPDPRVGGQGLQILKDAGIDVVEGIGADGARCAHAGFVLRVTKGRPLVTLKLAGSLDGRIATASGESRWITGPEARRYVHAQRLRHDAVLIGGGTARADDPDLTVRGLGVTQNPIRIVASRHLSVSPQNRLGQTARDVPVWLLHGEGPTDIAQSDHEAWSATGAELLPVPVATGGQLDLAASLRVLADRGITRVLCEGGGVLAASLLTADLVDRLVTFTAGLAIGAEGQPSLGALGLGALSDARRFRLTETRQFGDDVCCQWER